MASSALRPPSSASRRTQFASSSSLVRTSRRLGAVGTTTFSQSKVPERTDHDDGDKQTTQNNRATVTMPLRPFCEQRGSSASEAETGLPTGGAYANGSGAAAALVEPPGNGNTPPLDEPKEIWLVRHGQSEWNAASRIQGDTNESDLTEKGMTQATQMGNALKGVLFDGGCYTSPVKRASTTAHIIWSTRRDEPATAAFGEPASVKPLWELKEMNLLHLQGMKNADAAVQYEKSYRIWRETPHNFCGLEHGELAHDDDDEGDDEQGQKVYPVRELWTRAQVAWGKVLSSPGSRTLVVSHKSTLRAMVCVALGLPPEAFRSIDINSKSTTKPIAVADKSHESLTIFLPTNNHTKFKQMAESP